MLPRRTLLWGLLLGAGVARASPLMVTWPDDGLWSGEPGDPPRLVRPMPIRRPHVFSIRNDNETWTVWIETDALQQHWAFLRVEDEVIAASSTGADGSKTSVTFQVDRATATRLAAWLGVPPRERRPLGTGLEPTFERVDGTTVRMTLRNQGEAVGVITGGRQRGVRDNRFHFEVWRDGERLDELDGPDFGGISGVALVPTGGTLTREEDVAKWADLSAPGTYEVRCRYEAELVPGAAFVQWPETAHETWTPVYSGTIRIER